MAGVELIPPEGEREWVLDALRELVTSCGHAHLVCTPAVLPSPRHFPDAWSPNARGVSRLALRILRYAALPQLGVALEMFDDGQADAHADLGPGIHSKSHEGAAAWFAGIEDDTCWFGANVSLLDDPGGVTAALAHESAHAFRHVHQLEVDDRDLEECLTDLTTIYLGLGVLTANASMRHRSWSIDGPVGAHAWSTSHLGYLSPQAMCFGLAVFVGARERGQDERRAVLEALHPNQAGFYKAAERWLARTLGGPQGLRERLGLPDPQHWPAPTQLDDLLAIPLEDDEDDEHDEDEHEHERSTVGSDRGWNEGGKVHRVPYPPSPAVGVMLMVISIFTASMLLGTGHERLALVALVVGVVLARKLPRRSPRYECSTCRAFVGLTDEHCAICGGTVVGTLARAEDRLDLPEP